ncbi:MAG: hypothetical protein GY733_06170 [bacterium]|nr:hypothetical protein [bacterium]
MMRPGSRSTCSSSTPELLLGVLALFFASCLSAPHSLAADWNIQLTSAAATEPLSANLLGQYDLSGDLLAFDQVGGLIPAMSAVGFSNWRVGVGRWEAGTWILPILTDGSPCPPHGYAAPPGATDLSLIAARDWFSDNGQPVTLADTQDDTRYALDYARSVIDIATTFGTTAFVSIDSMPRALAVNTTPDRTDCAWTFQNAVSNVRPADNAIFASAVAGMVERIVEGDGSEPGRPVTHFEVWNEPELALFWDPAYEDLVGPLDRFFGMAAATLLELDAYRAGSTHPSAGDLRFGLGSFATAEVAAMTLAAFDSLPVPGGYIPLDFISFHGYSNDPLAVVSKIETVAAAAAITTNFQHVELVLAEWGSHLETTAGDPIYHSSMAPALHVTTVLALGAAAGLDRAHHAIFWNFLPDSVQLGLLANDLTPRPAYRAYELLSKVISEGAVRLPPTGFEDGYLDAGLGAVLASRDAQGRTWVLFANRNTSARTTEISIDGTPAAPTRLYTFDTPGAGIAQQVGLTVTFNVPAESLVLAEFAPPAVPAMHGSGALALVGLMLWLGVSRHTRIAKQA